MQSSADDPSGPARLHRQAGHGFEDDRELGEVVTTSVLIEEVHCEVRTESSHNVRTDHPHRPGHSLTLSAIVLDRARSLMAVMILATFVLTFIVQPFRIPSESMERTLLVGDFLLVNKVIYSPPGHWGWLLPYREPQHGDVVVFHFPLDPDDHVVKRLIGEKGDRLHMLDGVVYRNGMPLAEPYTRQATGQATRQATQPVNADRDAFRDDFPAARFTDPGVDAHWWTELQHDVVQGDLVVPADRYFVLGDHRDDSRDSRYWGFVPRVNVVGMPVLIYFSVREPSRTDQSPIATSLQPTLQPSMQPSMQDDRLGNSAVGRILSFARWERTLRVVQ